ncbi:MAG: glycosyltransferase, partial [Armatimonadota bacterium]
RDYATLFEAVRGTAIRVKIAAGGRFYSLGAARSLPPRPENVEFVPPTDSAGMRELHQRAAAVVVPLRADQMDATGCSVVLEAMACARPVVAGRTMGIAEYVRDGETGLLVDRGDPGRMRSALMQLLESEGLARKLGKQGRADSESRLALHTLVEGLARASQEASELT